MIKVIIVDDEKPARDLVHSFLSNHHEFKVIDEADNGFDACLKINRFKPDLVFLDVQMPKLTGIELLDLLEKPLPHIIFSTAYDQFAVQAFEKNAIDYLLKPYNQERFDQALSKLISKRKSAGGSNEQDYELLGNTDQSNKLRRIPVRSGSRIYVLKLEDIRYIEAQDDYIRLHSLKGKFLKQNTMKYMENNLPEDQFVRIHRSFILNIGYLSQLEVYDRHGYTAILSESEKLPVSRTGALKLKKLIRMD